MKNNNFKIAAICIFVLTALLFFKEYKIKQQDKEQSKRYEEDIVTGKKLKKEFLERNKSVLSLKVATINKCLKQVKSVAQKEVDDEMGIIEEYFDYMVQKREDSIESASNLQRLINKGNTQLIYRNEFGNEEDTISVNYLLEKLLNINDNYSSDKRYTEKYQAAVDSLKYVAIVQPIKHVSPKIVENEGYTSGYIVYDYFLYNIITGKMQKESVIVAKNGSKVSAIKFGRRNSEASLDQSDVESDLKTQAAKEVMQAVYGIKYRNL